MSSPPKSPIKQGSPSKTSVTSTKPTQIVSGDPENDEDYYTRPDFIYGGPFISIKLPSPFLDTVTPRNIPLQGTFRKSFAYYSLKERMPVILTKIIDYLSRESSKIISQNNASQEDVNSFMQTVTKLKNDLITNKEYDPFTVDTPEAAKWNKWIEGLQTKKYFLNSWMFTECYIYRKLKEGCELTKGLQKFDYFADQKNRAFNNNEEIMCVVADRVVTMLPKSEKDKRKVDFVTLLKICLWSNKCDLSLSLGSEVDLIKAAKDETERLRLNPPPPPPPPKGKKKKKAAAPAGPIIISSDPFQMILEMKDKVLADDCNKIADQVQSKAEKMQAKITAYQEAVVFKGQCTCNKLAKTAGVPICAPPPEPAPAEGAAPAAPGAAPAAPGAAPAAPGAAPAAPVAPAAPAAPAGPAAPAAPGAPAAGTGDEAPRIPCPAKITVPSTLFFDIVCDNAGYELFADLCLAHFLIAQEIVQKVRFHVKNMPWFVSDVTVKDFHHLIDACARSQFSAPSSTGATQPESTEPVVRTAENLRILADQWKKFVDEGVFMIKDSDFWTYPHNFKEMKKIDNFLYRQLQTGVACMFKGDLNYRKLVGDINLNPMMKFAAALQEFKPAPIIAVRTVKSETICGLGRGKFDAAAKVDPNWMQTGKFGVVQWAPKGEAFKMSDRPCIHYCTTCFGVVCPVHLDL